MHEDRPDPDELFLELSSPFANPYAPDEIGLLARLSLGGSRGASWFWLPLNPDESAIIVERVESLDIGDG